MKKLLLNITFLLISLVMIQSQVVFAQEIIPEPEKKEASPSTDEKVTTIEKSEKEEIKVVDDDDSKFEKRLNRKRNRKNEHFVDKDGDGINDNRCNGFGVNNGKCRGMKRGKK